MELRPLGLGCMRLRRSGVESRGSNGTTGGWHRRTLTLCQACYSFRNAVAEICDRLSLAPPCLGDVHSPNSAIGQVYRAGEAVRIAVVAPANIEGAHDGVVAARVVVSVQVPEIYVAQAVLSIRSLPDSVLAGAEGIVGGASAI